MPSSCQIKPSYFPWKYQSCKELPFWKIQASWANRIKRKECSDFFSSFFVIHETPAELKISISFQYFLIIKTEKHSTKHKHINYIKYSLYHQWFSLEVQNSLNLANMQLIFGIPVIQTLPDHMTMTIYLHWVALIYRICLSYWMDWVFYLSFAYISINQNCLYKLVTAYSIWGKQIFIKATNLSSKIWILSYRHISYLTLLFVFISKHTSVDISAAAIQKQ